MEVACRLSRAGRAALVAVSLLAGLTGCDASFRGFSGRDAEWQRQHGAFLVVDAEPKRAVVSADGNQVVVEPAAGFCLATDSIETSERSIFILIGDCVLDGPGDAVSPAALDSPTMPGIVTVSISGDPGFSRSGGSDRDLTDLESFLETKDGRALLGRGGNGTEVKVLDTRRIGHVLYVLVDDDDGDAAPVLAPEFWRAFVELNDRLAVVTVSGFRQRPMNENDMLHHLALQVHQLQVANQVPPDEMPPDEPPVEVALRSPPEIATSGSGGGLVGVGSKVVDLGVTTTGKAGQGGWPLPPRRPSEARGWKAAGDDEGRLASRAVPAPPLARPAHSAGRAPETAPLAPQRKNR